MVRLKQPPGVPAAAAPVMKEYAAKSRKTGADGKALWDSFSGRKRQGRACKQWLLDVLLETSGGRCAYCEAGEPTTVEHFWPKHTYPKKTFSLGNLMPVCVKCNGEKSDEFPLDDEGKPILLDLYNPEDDPVGFFAYTKDGGVVALRSGFPAERAEAVIRIVNLGRDWIANRRREAWALLTCCCEVYEQNPTLETALLLADILLGSHRGTMRYLIARDAEVARVIRKAADEHACVRAVVKSPPYAWPVAAGGSPS